MTLRLRPCLALLTALLLSACQSPQLVLSPELREQTRAMDVSGRQGFTWGRTLSFGEFKTSEVRRGWPTRTRVQFVLAFERAQQKLSFTQFGPGAQTAEVMAVGRFRSTEIPLLNGHLIVSPDYQNVFGGKVVMNDGQTVWDFVIDDPDGGTLRPVPGSASTADGRQQLRIEPVRRLEGQAAFMPALDTWGFEFRENGQVIAAVAVVNNGRVWIRADLSPERQQLVAALSSALLLRANLSDWGR